MRAFPRINALMCSLLLAGGIAAGQAAPLFMPASVPYTPITPTMADHTITLTGHDLTIEQVIAVARDGAQVRYSPEAIERAHPISTVARPLLGSNSSVLVLQPGNRIVSHGISCGRTWCERLSSTALAFWVFGLTFIGSSPAGRFCVRMIQRIRISCSI